MRGLDLILIAAGLMFAIGLVTVLAWFLYSSYLDRVERRLATRKGLYRELVAELATRDRALLEPTIHQISTLYDLDALEAVLEEQARTATGRPGWLLEVYDQLGLVDKYIEKLRGARKWRDRAFAAELLGRVGNAKAVPALLETVQATQTEDSDVREIALRALARIADPHAVGPLITALANAESWLAPRIADILARHGEAVVDPLLALLSDSSRHPARAWAANVLGEVRAQRAFPALVQNLDDPDDEVRAKSATALGRLGDRRAVAPLLDHLLSDPTPFVRVRIASALGQFGGPEVIDRLVRALGDPAWWVRMRGVEALEQIGPPAEGPLLVALSDPDPDIRQRAAVSLERLGVTAGILRMIESDDRAEEGLRTLMQLASAGTRELAAELLLHPSPRVREAVVHAIGQKRRGDLGPELAQIASRDPESSLRRLAFDTLRRLRASRSLPAAMTGVTDADPDVRTSAIRLLGRIGDRNSIELLRSQTADPDSGVRSSAIRALGELGARAAQPEFQRMMSDPEASVREAAVAGAAAAGLRPLAPAVLELLSDENERVRHAAADALGALGERSVVPALLQAFETAKPDLRSIIIHTVGRLDMAALSELIGRLNQTDDAGSRLILARLVGRMRWTEGWTHLHRLAQDPDPDVRATAIQGLGRSGRFPGPLPDALTDIIREALTDSAESVRCRAVEVCGRLCLDDHARTLLALLQSDPAERVRERAALAIGLMRSPGGETALMATCRRAESANVRAAAALGAGAYDRDSLVTLILAMPDETTIRDLLRERIKKDPWFRLLSRGLPRARDVELRALAAATPDQAQAVLATGVRTVLDASERVRLITGLRSFQGEESRAALLRLVRSDPSPEVRTAALNAVAERLDPDELLAFGSRALGDPNIMVRRAATRLFGKVPPSRGLPRLIQALQGDDDPAVLAAAGALAEENFGSFRETVLSTPLENDRAILVARLSRYIHHPDLSTVLTPLSRSAAPEVREAVAETWQHRPDASDPVALDAIMGDPEVIVRRAAAGAAVAAERYDLLDRMTQDPETEVRHQVAIALGQAPPIGDAGLLVLEHLTGDRDMAVRAAAHVARLLQGVPLPLPPDLDARVAAEAVRETADLGTLRSTARSAPSEDRRLSAALALALIQDDVAREVARSDPAPTVRHRVSGALELTLPSLPGESA